MKHGVTAALCVFLVVALFAGPAFARSTQGRLSDYKFIETPQQPANPPEIGGSMFQAAAATTTVLGWWQFDTPGGLPTKQGWIEIDMTSQPLTYFHVDGSGGAPCHAITPVERDEVDVVRPMGDDGRAVVRMGDSPRLRQ